MKACPVLLHRMRGRRAIRAALRELAEEAGIWGARFLHHPGRVRSVAPGEDWSFEVMARPGLPLGRDHRSERDNGQTYAFFLDDLEHDPAGNFDPHYRRALRYITPRIGAGDLS